MLWVIISAWSSFFLTLLAVTGLTLDDSVMGAANSGDWKRKRGMDEARRSRRRRPDTDNVTETLTQILKTYDVRLRPNFGGDALYIGIEVLLDNFLKVSEVDMDYTITLYLNQYWKDERLAFSSNDEMLVLSAEFAEKIWVPDTFFANDKQSFLHDVTEKNKMVRLHGDGSIMYGMRFTTTLSCNFDLHYYPLDSQNCTVEIESYGYTVRDLVMYWKGETDVGVEKVKPPQFIITSFDTNDRTEELATGVYQRLSLSFAIKRETSYFIFQTYLPSILIVMLSWVSFFINHEATAARVALGITTVLTMTTLSSSVRASLPRISYVKAIDIYLVMCFVFVFAALLEFATVNNTFWEKKIVKPPSAAKNPKIEISKPPSELQSKVKKAALEVMGLQSKVKNVRRPTSANDHLEDDDPSLSSIQVLDTFGPFPPVVGRIPRSTSFSGVSGVVPPHASHNIYGSPSVPVTHNKPPSRPRVSWRQRKSRLVQSIRKRTTVLAKCLPDVRSDVNIIDKFSRVAFPLSFLIFNVGYWGFYHEWNNG